mgnify:CR=1 FL=1
MSIELQSRISQIRESAAKNSFQNGELLSLAKDCISQNADKELLHQLLDIAHLSRNWLKNNRLALRAWTIKSCFPTLRA